jgi:hypothetical protein
MTYVKGIVKYLTPGASQDSLIELGALKPGEFQRWVTEVNPAWSQIFLSGSAPTSPPAQPSLSKLPVVCRACAAHRTAGAV